MDMDTTEASFAPRAQLTLADFEAALERDPEGLAGVYSTTEIEQAFAVRRFIDGKLKARRQEAAQAVIVRAGFEVVSEALGQDAA